MAEVANKWGSWLLITINFYNSVGQDKNQSPLLFKKISQFEADTLPQRHREMTNSVIVHQYTSGTLKLCDWESSGNCI